MNDQVPQLISVAPAPGRLAFGSVNEAGELEFTQVEWVGFTNYAHPEIFRNEEGRPRPHTTQWFARGTTHLYWETDMEHGTGRRRTGICNCESPDCRWLGIFDTSYDRAVESARRDAALRHEWLKKRETRKAKARAYNQARKAAAITV